MNTIINFLYRDAANYKFWYQEIVKGEITEDQKKTIFSTLDQGEYFIPAAVGLNCGYAAGYAPCDDDHPWCELWEDAFQLTNEPPTTELTTEELTAAFLNAKPKWEEYAAEVMQSMFA